MWPGLRQRKQALLAISSARSASVRGFNPPRLCSLATLRVSWVGSFGTYRLSSMEPASTSMGTTWLRQLLLWLAGEYWGRNTGLAALRRDTGFLVFSFPRSLGSGIYDEINGGQRKLVRTYLGYISTKFQPIWMRFGARVSKTPCQTLYPWVSVLARCFAYACTKSHPNRSKFGGDIAEINAHRFLLSPINFIINSTSQTPCEQKGQKTRVTP